MWRANKLTASEYDETTWFMVVCADVHGVHVFTTQRLSVAVQYSAAQEVQSSEFRVY